MRSIGRLSALFLLSTTSCAHLLCQQSATPRSILAGTLSLLGSTNLQALALSGNSETVAGATNDSGAFTASCGVAGSSQLSLQLGAGTHIEKRQISNTIPVGSWVDSEGTSHTMGSHNLYSPASWFCPALAIGQVLSTTDLDIVFAGNEEKNGATLTHFAVSSISASSKPQDKLLSHLSELEIFLDPQTFRPVVFDFTAHPDVDAGTDISIEIQFSNYTNVNGVWIPFTVRRYVNSSLALTLQVQTATPNAAIAVGQ